MRRKDFWPLTQARKLIHDFIPQLCHESDGLIFQGAQVGPCWPAPEPGGQARCSCVLGLLPRSPAAPLPATRRAPFAAAHVPTCPPTRPSHPPVHPPAHLNHTHPATLQDAYVAGTCPELLKWKFAHMNSVDFRLRRHPASGWQLELLETRRGGDYQRGYHALEGGCGHVGWPGWPGGLGFA